MLPVVCLREGGWYVSCRCRHERGDMEPSPSWWLVLTSAIGISSSLGLSVFVVVETEDGAMVETTTVVAVVVVVVVVVGGITTTDCPAVWGG
jgi:hypothetical protein